MLLSTIVETVKNLIDPLANEHGYQLVNVEYEKEGKNWFLRLFIDKEGGVDLEDCSFFSEKVSEKLDSQDPDPIPFAYYLEVSSPGAERPIKNELDWVRAEEEYIHVTLHQAVDGNSMYEGTLEELNEDEIILSYRDKTRTKKVTINRENVATARFAIQF